MRGNTGQTAALACGFKHAQGEFVVAIDGDGQNDPADIPRLLAKLEEGYDLVSGWRMERWQNAVLTRRLPSLTANWLISSMTGVRLHDYGCTLKAYRGELAQRAQALRRDASLRPGDRGRAGRADLPSSKSNSARGAPAAPSMACGGSSARCSI